MIAFNEFIQNLARLKTISVSLVPCSLTALLLSGGCSWNVSSPPQTAFYPASPAAQRVRVLTRREGDLIRVLVENDEWSEITVTFNYALTNLKSSASFPLTKTFAPHQTTEAFTVSPADPNAPWKFSFTNYYHLGSNRAAHDDSVLYSLPYAPGKSFRVTQGYGGRFSHTGANRYSIDWDLPSGTPVYAARGGLVIKTKDDSEFGGADPKFDRFNNYVLILHSDGTIGDYCHLQKGGVQVRAGECVTEGKVIALSGGTGFSSGPHLHFSVFKALTGRDRESIPIRFKTADLQGITLESGRKYIARPGAPVVQKAPTRTTTGA